MTSRRLYVAIAILLIAGMFLAIRTNITSVASQTKSHSPALRPETQELQDVIQTLRDQNLRKSSPQEFVKVIRRACVLAGANTFANNDEASPPKIYSTELLDVLINLLDWEQPRRTDEFDPAYGQPIFPAIEAIYVMRKPVLPYLVEVLKDESPASLKSKNALSTIQLILNRNDIEIFNYLQAQATIAETDMGKTNLLKAADLVQLEFMRKQKLIGN